MAQWAVERPDLDVSPQALIGRLHRIGDALHTELRPIFAAAGLSDGDFDVLAALRRAGAPYELTPGAIGETTMVTSGAVSKRLDRLEAAGLVVRRVGDADARSRVVGLTERGLAVVDELFTAHIANEHRLVAGFSDLERSRLAHLLELWARELGC